jgi:hypothetical protein
MKKTLRIAALAVALSLAGAASAQQAQPASSAHRTRVGIGVGLPTNEFSTIVAGGADLGVGIVPQLYVPIDLTPRFRLEPQVGILTVDQDGGTDTSIWSIGAGAFYLMPLGQQAQLYVGPRLLLSFFHQDNPVGGGIVEKTSGTDWFLAAALGGELMPHPRIGVGAEAQLGRWGIGDRETKATGFPTQTTPGGSSWQTQGIIFVRVYLN